MRPNSKHKIHLQFIYACTHMVSRGFHIILLVCLHLPQPITLGQEWNFPHINYVIHGSKFWMLEYSRFHMFRWRMCNVDLGLQIKDLHFLSVFLDTWSLWMLLGTTRAPACLEFPFSFRIDHATFRKSRDIVHLLSTGGREQCPLPVPDVKSPCVIGDLPAEFTKQS